MNDISNLAAAEADTVDQNKAAAISDSPLDAAVVGQSDEDGTGTDASDAVEPATQGTNDNEKKGV